MDNTAQFLASVLGAGGAGAVLLALVNGLIKWLSGASSRERAKSTDLVNQRVRAIEEREKAIKQRDLEAEKRRRTSEYASRLRRILIEHGITPEPWPTDTTEIKIQIKDVQDDRDHEDAAAQ